MINIFNARQRLSKECRSFSQQLEVIEAWYNQGWLSTRDYTILIRKVRGKAA